VPAPCYARQLENLLLIPYLVFVFRYSRLGSISFLLRPNFTNLCYSGVLSSCQLAHVETSLYDERQ
jgi:hypothetical protein